MKRTGILALVFAVGSTACMKQALVVPAEDHYVQTLLIADSCEADGYGQGKCTAADLRAMAVQACLINAIVHGDDAATCTEGQGDK